MKKQLPIILFVAFLLLMINVFAFRLAIRESGANYKLTSGNILSSKSPSLIKSRAEDLENIAFPYSAKGLLAWALTLSASLIITSVSIKVLLLRRADG